MGACASSPAAAGLLADDPTTISKVIDKGLEEDGKRLRKECKILLLGSGESGKSTIVKQMKIIHQQGFTQDELLSYKQTIFRNVLDSAQALVTAVEQVGLELSSANRATARAVMEIRLDPNFTGPQGGDGGAGMAVVPMNRHNEISLTPELADGIQQLWKDPVVHRVLDEHGSEFYLMDSASYFFQEVLRIGSPDYVPNEKDVLRARLKTTGITETRFKIEDLSIHMFDVGGQRSERRKWIHCFESVTSIIFCTSLSEYDQVLLEEKGQNRMIESLSLFDSVINSRWFLRTSIILFLNKIDVFKVKLPKIPLSRYFPEYTGGADLNKAAKYILWKFMQTNRARLSVYPHLTQATETGNVKRVFVAVKETILKNALKDSGIL